MKALSLWQPWASLMAVGAKEIETRSWATKYRGDLVICAAKHWDDDCARTIRIDEVKSALSPIVQNPGMIWRHSLQFGVALCVVALESCVDVEKVNFDQFGLNESFFGNYELGRYAWITGNLRRLRHPVPVLGKQLIFDLSADDERAVRDQIP